MNAVVSRNVDFKNQPPLISVIIATFNAGKDIAACIESIITQAYKNIEIVVVDGGSTDNTVDVLKQFDYHLLNWISEPDKGIFDALNKGAMMANGKWLHFLGADDRLLPGFSEMVAWLKDEDTVYYGDSKEFYDGQGEPAYHVLTGSFSKYRLAKYCINHQAIIYPSTVFKKYQYELKYKVFADYVLNMQVWGDRNFKKVYHPVFIVLYSLAGFSTKNSDRLFERDKAMLIKKSMGWPVYLRFRLKNFKKKINKK